MGYNEISTTMYMKIAMFMLWELIACRWNYNWEYIDIYYYINIMDEMLSIIKNNNNGI